MLDYVIWWYDRLWCVSIVINSIHDDWYLMMNTSNYLLWIYPVYFYLTWDYAVD